MQAVIGSYPTSQDAERAVRRLEGRRFSIQDMIVADQRQRAWRKLSRWYDRRKSTSNTDQRFLVVMSGRQEEIERAGTLLAAEAA
jgi:transposase